MDLGDLTTVSAPTGPAASLDPRWKLAGAALAIACILLLQGLAMSALALAGSFILVLWARLPWPWVGARLGAVLPFLLLFALPLPWLIHDPVESTWQGARVRFSLHGAAVAVVLLAKALSVLAVFLFVLGTASLDATLKAARALKVPALFVHLVLLSHRYLFVLGEEFARLRIALRVRGFRDRADRHSYRTIGNVAGVLLVRGHERAERVAQAMRCRGFTGRFHSLAEFHTTARDVLLFVLISVPAVALVALDYCVR